MTLRRGKKGGAKVYDQDTVERIARLQRRIKNARATLFDLRKLWLLSKIPRMIRILPRGITEENLRHIIGQYNYHTGIQRENIQRWQEDIANLKAGHPIGGRKKRKARLKRKGGTRLNNGAILG